MPAVTASLVGVTTPQAVQVAVSGLTVGDTYDITGSVATAAGVVSWPVRAGRGTATSTQVVVGDAAAPVNAPITYTVQTGANGSAASAPLTVPHAGRYLLQSVDGRTTATFGLRDNADPRTTRLRTATYAVSGRSRPPSRWDVAAGENGDLLLATAGTQTAALKALLEGGGPLLLRTDGAVRDLAPVEYVLPTAATRTLTGAWVDGTPQTVNERLWQVRFEVIDDPEPDTALALSSWDDFDATYAGLSGNDFDAEWAGQDGNTFDREDWASRA